MVSRSKRSLLYSQIRVRSLVERSRGPHSDVLLCSRDADQIHVRLRRLVVPLNDGSPDSCKVQDRNGAVVKGEQDLEEGIATGTGFRP